MDVLEHLERLAKNALREKWEIDAALAVCRACEHFAESDVSRDGMPTCAKCISCSTRIVRFLTRRWACPLGKWGHWKEPSLGKMPWEALWDLHHGKTFLVIGRGPSRDEVDLNSIERDVTIAANLSLWEPEKQAELVRSTTKAQRHEGGPSRPGGSTFLYDLSTDEGPCKLARPAGVKLCSNANTDAGRKARAGCDIWVCFPHHVYNWGPIERGNKLPTAFNSGIAGVTLALYMGAKRVKFVGIDYREAPGGGMHSNDADESAKTTSVRRFNATFARVQKAAHEVARWCEARGVALENLARDSHLDWSGATGRDGIKLYPGAGTHRLPGYVHADIRPGVCEHILDIEAIPWELDGRALGDGEASDLYLSHVLEHVPFRKVEAVLDECGRVVRPGGAIEVRVPDLRAIMEWALRAEILERGHVARVFGAQDYPENTHVGGFDALGLERALWHAGFEEVHVERVPWQKGDRGMELRATARRRRTTESGSAQ